MPNQLVLVAGNIGSGKTSLTQHLGQRLGWVTAYESVADNPYLPEFYKDMRAWSFHLQVYFLGHRAQQHLDLWQAGQPAIIDRSIYEDAHIFARALQALGNMTDLDMKSYLKVFDLVTRSLPAPDLLIYLDAPVPLLVERIRKRGRAMENGITPGYLALLDSFYHEWISSFTLCPLLKLDTGVYDFVNDAEHQDEVLNQITARLKA